MRAYWVNRGSLRTVISYNWMKPLAQLSSKARWSRLFK